MHALEDWPIAPDLEYSSTCQMNQVYLAFRAVGIAEPDSVTTEWPNFDYFCHQEILNLMAQLGSNAATSMNA